MRASVHQVRHTDSISAKKLVYAEYVDHALSVRSFIVLSLSLSSFPSLSVCLSLLLSFSLSLRTKLCEHDTASALSTCNDVPHVIKDRH